MRNVAADTHRKTDHVREVVLGLGVRGFRSEYPGRAVGKSMMPVLIRICFVLPLTSFCSTIALMRPIDAESARPRSRFVVQSAMPSPAASAGVQWFRAESTARRPTARASFPPQDPGGAKPAAARARFPTEVPAARIRRCQTGQSGLNFFGLVDHHGLSGDPFTVCTAESTWGNHGTPGLQHLR